VLEEFKRVDVLILDKTGTVTEGDFRVLHSVGGALVVAAPIECYSEHPLGRAIVREAARFKLPLPAAVDIQVRKGLGIAGTVDGTSRLAGNRRMLTEAGVEIPAAIEEHARSWEERGHTVAFAACAGVCAGAIAFGDQVREQAAPLAAELRRRGIRTVLLSGDASITTARVAAAIGVDEFRAEVLPGDKQRFVEECRAGGSVVAMVGDGVNDAPALAAANLGIALGSGADLTMQAAPVVLMESDLGRVLEVFDLSRRTLLVVAQNLFWAFFYNVVGITLAITGVLTPILAAVAMVLSSLSVIGNSLRLKRVLQPSRPAPDAR
jgi:P-type E1-E2 ATPase